jgi:glycosyltransferase involved in cell wall biosynthesis
VHVCFFNRSYWPDTGATGQLLTELAEDLVAHHGWQVTVVTGRPRGAHAAAREWRNGVQIIRARGTTFDPRRFVGRAVNYLTYFVSAAIAAARLPSHDVSAAMTDPPIIGLAALMTARRTGGAFVFICQDVFPEVAVLVEDFRSRIVDGVLDWVNRYLLRHADRIVVLGASMQRRLVIGKGADPARITIIHNWADAAALGPGPKDSAFTRDHGLSGHFVLMHAGNIGLSQNLDVVLDAAERLRRDDRIRIVLLGDGSRRQALQQTAVARGLTNVAFLPYQPRAEMRQSYAAADVFLVSLQPGLSGFIVPSKVYSILAAGKPFLAAMDSDSEAVAIAREHDCGVAVPPADPESLAAAIRALADDPARVAQMGRRARAASALFDRPRQVSEYARLLSQAACL